MTTKPNELVLFNCVLVLYPYDHTFTASAKERWLGRTVQDVFATEFSYYSKDYLMHALQGPKPRLENNTRFKY